MRALILTPGELTRDPRARRAVEAARRRGIDVVGLSGGLDTGPPVEFPGVVHVRAARPRLTDALRSAGLGGMRRSNAVARELRGLFRLGRLLVTTIRLVRAARPLGRFDVLHANDFDTLPAARLIARRGSARLVYDAHEIYVDQEPDAPRAYRAVAARLEAIFARRADAVVTVSEPIAAELTARLRLPRPAIAVLNCPARADATLVANEGPLRAIYQGAMGPGRPLGDLLTAAASGEGIHLTLRIAGADVDRLREAVEERGLGDRVTVEWPVPPDRLLEGLRGHDVGLIINRPVTRNDELVFPNKLFEYMMAGLAVVAPRLEGLGPFVDANQIGATYAPARPDLLGEALSVLAGDRKRLARARERARELALGDYNAETQAEKLAAAWSA